MSDRLALAQLSSTGGFRLDARFAANGAAAAMPLPEMAETEPQDALALAWAEGHAAGVAEERERADKAAAADTAARERLALSFARIDDALEEELRQRLRDTVTALCEAAIAPLALDAEALARRVAVAAAMLARADDERVIRLHPDDIALVSERLAQDWTVLPDPALERGALRIEGSNGGVEDGPAIWRSAIAEALSRC